MHFGLAIMNNPTSLSQDLGKSDYKSNIQLFKKVIYNLIKIGQLFAFIN
jgi:hypothetical protein